MNKNEGNLDRIIRIAAGAALLVAGFGFVSGALGIVLAAVGGILTVTGLIGWCPLYALFGFNTCPIDKSRSEARTHASV